MVCSALHRGREGEGERGENWLLWNHSDGVMDLLEHNECEDGDTHGNEGYGHTHIADDFQGEPVLITDVERSCAEQDGKVREMIALAHRHRVVGESLISRASILRPLANTENAVRTTETRHILSMCKFGVNIIYLAPLRNSIKTHSTSEVLSISSRS